MSFSSFTVATSTGVPAGTYLCEFVSITPFTDNAERYDEGVLLAFRVIGGLHDGEAASRICSRKFSPKSNLYGFAQALAGRELQTGEAYDFADYVGTKGIIFVEKTESGSTRVASFLKSAD
jgi:hypothetical protein